MKMEKKRYYKITTEIAGGQVSFIIFNSKAEVQYQIGEWAEAPDWLAKKGYGLFVFDSLKNAMDFLGKLGDPSRSKMWRCEIEGRYEKLPPNLTLDGINRGVLVPAEFKDFPKGTVMAKRVKLIRQIKTKKERKND